MMIDKIKNEIKKAGDPVRAKLSAGYFKTGKGDYGEGDIFLGLSVPQQRLIARKYLELPLSDIQQLLKSKIHEHRFTALVIMVMKYKSAGKSEREKIYKLYLSNAKRINNWDLVDTSAPNIVGEHLVDKDRKILIKLAKSKNLWEKRIAVLSTFAFIRRDQYTEALYIAEILLQDKHDLIHKAVGWMLREVGKRSLNVEETFLKKHYKHMPRTALRYAIERMPRQKRLSYLI
jgi:3-methyladenine DNA glycosylase AlkD